MEAAGFTDVRARELAPDWYRDERVPYALAVSGVKPAPGPSPAARAAAAPEEPVGPLRFAARFVLGSRGGRRVRADRGRAGAARAAGEGARGMTRAVTARALALPRALDVLWRFSRPHTIIGTALSIVGLYAIAAAERGAPGVGDLLATLVAGLTVNIAIVGVNQITDVEIDRVNKPWLPIAAGDLSPGAASAIVAACTAIPLAMALTQGAEETVAVAAGLAVGALYSLPPARLKRFPVAASLCITGVRSVVVNLGVYWHFAGAIDPPVWALCLFVLPFSFAIAVLKDVPDIEGDRRFSIRTFTVRLGPERVFHARPRRARDRLRRDDRARPAAARRLRRSVAAGRRPRWRGGAPRGTGR